MTEHEQGQQPWTDERAKLQGTIAELIEANTACARLIADLHMRLITTPVMPDDVRDTIRRSLVASESINSTDAWYKRMTIALEWLDAQPHDGAEEVA